MTEEEYRKDMALRFKDKLQAIRDKAAAEGVRLSRLDAIDEDHLNCVWYGGIVAELSYRGYTVQIIAAGDIHLFGRLDSGEEVNIKDKNNSGRAYDEIGREVTDKGLLRYLDRGRDMNYDAGFLLYDNNNWFEFDLVDERTGEYIDCSFCDNVIDDDLLENLSDFSYYKEFIDDYIENEKGGKDSVFKLCVAGKDYTLDDISRFGGCQSDAFRAFCDSMIPTEKDALEQIGKLLRARELCKVEGFRDEAEKLTESFLGHHFEREEDAGRNIVPGGMNPYDCSEAISTEIREHNPLLFDRAVACVVKAYEKERNEEEQYDLDRYDPDYKTSTGGITPEEAVSDISDDLIKEAERCIDALTDRWKAKNFKPDKKEKKPKGGICSADYWDI